MMTMTRVLSAAVGANYRDPFEGLPDRLEGAVRRLARRVPVTRAELGTPMASDPRYAPDSMIHSRLSPQLAGTRLAYHLTLLKKLGAAAKRRGDARHQNLVAVGDAAAHALAGATTLADESDPFERLGIHLKDRGIRDQLIGHAKETGLIKSKADERQYRQWWDNLAHGYNWDRVTHVLAVDSAVREYLDRMHDPGAANAPDKFRRIAKAFVQNPGLDGTGPKHRQHDEFWAGLRTHVRSRLAGLGIHGSLTTEPQLQRSILRHAFQETDAADMAGSKRWGDAMHMTPPRKADQPMAPERYARALGRGLMATLG